MKKNKTLAYSLKEVLALEKIIKNEQRDWFCRWIEKHWDVETRTIDEDPPTLFDAFSTGWWSRDRFDEPKRILKHPIGDNDPEKESSESSLYESDLDIPDFLKKYFWEKRKNETKKS